MNEPTFHMRPEVLENLRIFISSPVWTEFFLPAVTSMKEGMVADILDPSRKREEDRPDDYLRGCIATLDALASLPDAVIAEHDAERERKQEEERELQELSDRADSGYVGL